MPIDKSNLKFSSTMMSIPLPSSENKENLQYASSSNQQQSQLVLSNEIESREAWNDRTGMEPLDFRQDWSQEIIDTFGKLQSRFPLEQVLSR